MSNLASAEPTVWSDAMLPVVLASLGIIVIAALLAFVPVAISWRRRYRHSERIAAASILWALFIAGVSISAVVNQTTWSRERTLRIKTGFYDPQDLTDAPALPWSAWAILAAAYAALLIWSAASRPSGSEEPSPR